MVQNTVYGVRLKVPVLLFTDLYGIVLVCTVRYFFPFVFFIEKLQWTFRGGGGEMDLGK